jgi:hypothetical protein
VAGGPFAGPKVRAHALGFVSRSSQFHRDERALSVLTQIMSLRILDSLGSLKESRCQLPKILASLRAFVVFVFHPRQYGTGSISNPTLDYCAL